MIDKDHQQKFIDVWERGEYRRGSTAQRLVQRLMEWIPEGATVNDYGCGTGRAEVEIHQLRPSQRITMLDITETALEEPARALISEGGPITFIESDLSNLGDLPRADWGMCINVLMTVQPDKLDRILAEIKRTCQNVVIEVYQWSDVRLGREYTTVKMDKKEWAVKLARVWPSVKIEESRETAQRYIFVCLGDLHG